MENSQDQQNLVRYNHLINEIKKEMKLVGTFKRTEGIAA